MMRIICASKSYREVSTIGRERGSALQKTPESRFEKCTMFQSIKICAEPNAIFQKTGAVRCLP
jgi:hypothetical protein